MTCERLDLVSLYVLDALPEHEVCDVEAHLFGCAECQQELRQLRPVIDEFAHWPVDVLRPSSSLGARLAGRMAAETDGAPLLPQDSDWREPEWEEVAPGISCKVLAMDNDSGFVSMLVRLAPGAEYPPHKHAGVEELHLLEGELWIDDRKLYPGDYNRGEPGTSDRRVWSETGCTCALMTSTRDILA